MVDIYGCDNLYTENLADEKGSDVLTILFIVCFALVTFICSCVDEINRNNT